MDGEVDRSVARDSSRATDLRLAAIIDTSSVSGPGRQLAALLARLRTAEVKTLVVTFHRTGRPRSPYLEYLERAGVEYAVLEERGRFDIGVVRRLSRLLDDWHPHLVQTHGYKPTVFVYLLRRLGAPWRWLAFFHGGTAENAAVRFYTFLNNRLLGAADRVVVMSRDHIARFAHLGGKASIIHNAALDLPRLTGGAGESALLRRGATPRIAVVGRLSPEKGVDVFLRGCRELTTRGVTFRALIVGDGPERARLERMRAELDLEDCVEFVGAVDDMPAMYATLDLLVIPSRSEGLPNVLLEALNADIPVVATRVGAIPEVLEDTSAGWMVPPDSPADLADAIAAALVSQAEEEGRRARRAVVERFSLERRASEHLRLYAELCPSHGLACLTRAGEEHGATT
jgi:glycosyltransferase involved in cell wall biosynthesis